MQVPKKLPLKESHPPSIISSLTSYKVLSTGILILFSVSEKNQLSSTGKNISALHFCHCQKYTHLLCFIKKKNQQQQKPKQKHTHKKSTHAKKLTRHEHQGKLEMPSPGSNPSATETQTQASALPLSWLSHRPLGLSHQRLWAGGLFKVKI